MLLGDLFEARSISNPLLFLRQYRGMKNVFVHFTNINKIGVNPRSEYATPSGVYGYPLEYVFEHSKISHLPFGSKFKYIYVIKATKPILDLQEYSEDDLENDLHYLGEWVQEYNSKMREKYPKHYKKYGDIYDDSYSHLLSLRHLEHNSLVKSPGGYLWRAIYNFANNKSARWNQILRYLGYDIVKDNGDGIIHENEPNQTIFLTPDSYRVLSVTNNDERQGAGRNRYNVVVKMLSDNPEHFYEQFVTPDVKTFEDLNYVLLSFDKTISEMNHRLEKYPKFLAVLQKHGRQQLLDNICETIADANGYMLKNIVHFLSPHGLEVVVKKAIDLGYFFVMEELPNQPETIQEYFLNHLIERYNGHNFYNKDAHRKKLIRGLGYLKNPSSKIQEIVKTFIDYIK